MKAKDFDELGSECIDHLTALNPKGGIKEFVRMSVEFGYKRAVKNLTIPDISNNEALICNECGSDNFAEPEKQCKECGHWTIL